MIDVDREPIRPKYLNTTVVLSHSILDTCPESILLTLSSSVLIIIFINVYAFTACLLKLYFNRNKYEIYTLMVPILRILYVGCVCFRFYLLILRGILQSWPKLVAKKIWKSALLKCRIFLIWKVMRFGLARLTPFVNIYSSTPLPFNVGGW